MDHIVEGPLLFVKEGEDKATWSAPTVANQISPGSIDGMQSLGGKVSVDVAMVPAVCEEMNV